MRKRFYRTHRGIVVACLLAASALPRSSWAGQEAAKQYFQNGVDLITGERPNYQDAYYQFQLAYQESGKSWKVLGNLGLCALKLERDQEAVTYYEEYLKKGGGEIAKEERAAIEQDLLLLKGNLATLVLSSTESDVKLTDGRAGSAAPPQPYSLVGGRVELKLRAGSHTITARAGDKQLVWQVVLEPKSLVTHALDFDAKAPTPARAPVVVAPAPSPKPEPRRSDAASGTDLRVPGYVLLGVGAVGVGLGGFFLWQGSDYDRQADEIYVCNQTKACTADQISRVKSLESSTEAARVRGAVAAGVGGAALITGTVLLLASSHGAPARAPSARLRPWVGLGSLGVDGQF